MLTVQYKLVFQLEKYEIYAVTWDDIFKSFDLRHSFLLDKLNYDREILSKELIGTHIEQSKETSNDLTKTAIAL